ncbi:branched-chain amino acid ABC transporter permease [candidate division KSB3 bacterium]|uniref:Branched-chain amino acid ABC transporter permease n=1 Tax=candidate division KSB3 bacterium TaxID=2044937 RepID=A0A2G6E2S5_9BACT|nr:MAG: branched-chain amino acid ABC transporter permease [candidate division KSB3 bacterium]PIE28632.1 MAG: branched-chain amino acid ABC transporter permease [candidate division KSB3 bacterium]
MKENFPGKGVLVRTAMLLQQIMNGVTQGSIYSLVAIGYVLIFGTMNMVSFAHGETLMMGAFIGFFAVQFFHLPLFAALLLAFLGGWLIGMLTELLFFRGLRGATHMPPLLLTIGLSTILKEMAGISFGYENQAMPSFYLRTFRLGAVQISLLQLLILATVAVLVLLLQLLLYKTRLGMAMRAISQDYRMAGLLGMHVDRIYNLSFALASALGAVAGVLIAVYYTVVSPFMGGIPGLKGFIACIFGGLTSIPGAIFAGLIIGIVENLTVEFLSSGYQDTVAFAILILVLCIRPQGLMGKKNEVY